MHVFKRPKNNIELVVVRNALNTTSEDIDCYEGSDLIELLEQAFASKRFPAGVELFHEGFTAEHKVTPTDEASVNYLLRLRGRIYAVIVPMGVDPVSLAYIAIGIVLAAAATYYMIKHMMPVMADRQGPPSPNNALSQRTNRQRVGGRIPEIVGQVWSTPDLVAPPYSLFIDHAEIEYSYMCAGRGSYFVHKAYDDTTDVSQILGTTVQVYNPSNDIRGPADFTFGNEMTEREKEHSRLAVRRYTAVNGQVLPSPDDFFKGDKNISFIAPNIIRIYGDNYTFEGQFDVGNTVKIEGGDNLESEKGVQESGAPIKYNVTGEYSVLSAQGRDILLDNPAAINAGWAKLVEHNDQTIPASPTISTESKSLWLDWQYTTDAKAEGLIFNLVASGGIYKTHKEGDKFMPFGVDFAIEAEQVDDEGVPIEGTKIYQASQLAGRLAGSYGGKSGLWDDNGIEGSDFLDLLRKAAQGLQYNWLWTSNDESRRTAAKSIFVPIAGKSRFRVSRISETIAKGEGEQIVDEVKIKDLYSYRTLDGVGETVNDHVTLVCVKTKATEGALSIKERKLKLLLTRYINNPDGDMILSKRADDIIYHLATDPKIGGLYSKRLNMPQIYGEMDLLREYFNSEKFSEFCYTFDDTNMSSEETLQLVAQAVYSQIYRFNNQVQIHFERPQNVSVAIFNSHNIIPESYKQNESFGIPKDFDGVKLKYTDPTDDAQVELQVPFGKTLVNADEQVIAGVRNKEQALAHAWRMWNKLVFGYKTVDFVGADESNIIIPHHRIDVSDQQRVGVMQGIVTQLSVKNGFDLVLELSDPISREVDIDTHTIFIQMVNGQVDYMKVRRVSDFEVLLPRLPIHAISADLGNVVQSTYALVANRETERDSYVVSAKEMDEGLTNKITAYNYDARYYRNDVPDYSETIIGGGA